ncbi:MAG TPA: SDR family oxidoreductase [Burkholderiales bacterium]|nr:SDR family oxidoreductase [Burkholderiales bacterium]
MTRRVLIVGATSAIAEATARIFAAAGDRLYLVARNRDRVDAIARDLTVRGAAAVATETMDLNDVQSHMAMIERAVAALGGLDTVLVAHGTLPDQKKCEGDFAEALQALNTNCLSAISLLTHAANRLAAQRHGTIAVISSVAGDRGRQSNYVYGTAKAALNAFLQGLRNRLHTDGVHVLTIKPGFVDTPMTASFRKGLLWASPRSVARGIYGAIERERDVVYLPWFWRWIMLIIRSVPERVFKKLRL